MLLHETQRSPPPFLLAASLHKHISAGLAETAVFSFLCCMCVSDRCGSKRVRFVSVKTVSGVVIVVATDDCVKKRGKKEKSKLNVDTLNFTFVG